MFKPFKSLFADDPVQIILENTYLPHTQTPIASLMTQSQRQNSVMTLTLKLPAGYDADLQPLHDELADALEPHGILELNLHVIASRAPSVEPGVFMPTPSVPSYQGQTQGGNGQWQSQSQSQSQGAFGQFQGQSLGDSFQGQTSFTAPESAKVFVPQPHQTQSQTSDPVPHHAETTAPTRPAPPTQQQLAAHPHIRHVLVVASGKGGVGKSTTAVNLALALKKAGARVGILDADIYGPSIPAMLNIAGQSPLIENEQFIPLEAYGLAAISIGNLTGDDNTPIAWRGPKATGALMQLFNQTAWPKLDYLVIDMPPGTGDIQLTLAQRIPVSAAIIVTTPQHIALLDAQKGLELFNKVNIPVLGIIENMAVHICSNCGHTDEIFGHGGAAELEARYHVPVLGQLPLDASIRIQADAGRPSVVAEDSAAPLYQHIALRVIEEMAKVPERARDPNRIF